MNRNKEEIEEEEDEEDEEVTLEDIEKQILREMKHYQKTSPEYRALLQRLNEITECQRNKEQAKAAKAQRWNWAANLAGNIIGNSLKSAIEFGLNRKTVNDVLDYEKNGDILTTKSTSFIKKP